MMREELSKKMTEANNKQGDIDDKIISLRQRLDVVSQENDKKLQTFADKQSKTAKALHSIATRLTGTESNDAG